MFRCLLWHGFYDWVPFLMPITSVWTGCFYMSLSPVKLPCRFQDYESRSTQLNMLGDKVGVKYEKRGQNKTSFLLQRSYTAPHNLEERVQVIGWGQEDMYIVVVMSLHDKNAGKTMQLRSSFSVHVILTSIYIKLDVS